MAKKTQGTFRVPGGFTLQSNKPVLDSETVEFLSDLISPTELPDIYQGLIVHVEETNRHYTWNGQNRTLIENWTPISVISIKNKDGIEQFVVTDELKFDERHLFDPITKEVKGNPNVHLTDGSFITNPITFGSAGNGDNVLIKMPYTRLEYNESMFLKLLHYPGDSSMNMEEVYIRMTMGNNIVGEGLRISTINSSIMDALNNFEVRTLELNDEYYLCLTPTKRSDQLSHIKIKECRFTNKTYEEIVTSLNNITSTDDISGYNIVESNLMINPFILKGFYQQSTANQINGGNWITVMKVQGNNFSGTFELFGNESLTYFLSLDISCGVHGTTIRLNKSFHASNRIQGIRIARGGGFSKLQLFMSASQFLNTKRFFSTNLYNLNLFSFENEVSDVNDEVLTEINIDQYEKVNSDVLQNINSNYYTSNNLRLINMPSTPEGLLPGQLWKVGNDLKILDPDTLNLGAEMFPDPTFIADWDNDAGYNNYAGPTLLEINGSLKKIVNNNTGGPDIYADCTLLFPTVVDKLYLLKFDRIGNSNSSLDRYIFGGTTNRNYEVYKNLFKEGTFYFIIKALTASTLFQFGKLGTGEINNMSLKQLEDIQ